MDYCDSSLPWRVSVEASSRSIWAGGVSRYLWMCGAIVGLGKHQDYPQTDYKRDIFRALCAEV